MCGCAFQRVLVRNANLGRACRLLINLCARAGKPPLQDRQSRAAGLPAAAWSLHPCVHHDAEEAELGAS